MEICSEDYILNESDTSLFAFYLQLAQKTAAHIPPQPSMKASNTDVLMTSNPGLSSI